jgi:endonuclease YncB( thermonuclease family)
MAPRVGAFLFAWLMLAGAHAAPVERALDGDSLLLRDGRQVRLIGINTPEFGKDGAPHQPLAREAQQRLAQLTEGKRVRLEPGREARDRHGRTLAHVHVGETNVEEILLREGLAWLVAIPPNVVHVARLRAAETDARRAGRGVWAERRYDPVAAERLGTSDAGFRFVTGQVRAVRNGKRAYYLELAPRVVLIIPHDHWKDYFAREQAYARGPYALAGRRLVARGWLSERNGELRLRVGHPAMLDWLD